VTTTSLKACLKACSDVNLCAGVVFGQFSGEDTIPAASCKLIMGKSLPGSCRRTLIKANFMGLNTDMKVSKGYYSQPASPNVAICPASDAGDTGFCCPGGPAPGAAPRQACQDPSPAGTHMPAGTEKADDCGAWLKAGWYYDFDTTAVVACEPDSYCPGDENFFGATADVGIYACPAGTKSPASSSSIADCNALYAGYFYQAPGAISSDTIKSCDEGFWCNTEDVAINVGTTTPADASGGRNPCPAGSLSAAGVYPAAGPILETQCTRLLAGYQYAGTADISDATINTCGADRYCEGEQGITNGGAANLGTACIEGTGVAQKADANAAGASSVNDRLKLYEGYYYTGIGTGISRTTVLPCPANSFCPGYPRVARSIVHGIPSLPTACPAGTEVAVGVAFLTDAAFFTANANARGATSSPTSVARSAADAGGKDTNDCDTLRDGYWYNGPGDISSSTVQLCTADYFCNTEDLAITKNTNTAPGATLDDAGINPCPAGVNSEVGSNSINDCNILEPRFYYTGGPAAISDTTVVACPVKSYW
jgi:hypothetical protein